MLLACSISIRASPQSALLFYSNEWWLEITPISTEITPRRDISTPTLPTVRPSVANLGHDPRSLERTIQSLLF
jgi:hypothetical protein